MVRRHSSFSLGSLLLALLLPNSIINNNNGVGLLLGANAQGGNGTASIPDDFDDTDDTLASAVYERATSAEDPDSISIFRDALEAVDLLDTVLGNASGTYTVFAPTNAAVNASAEFVLYLTNLTALPRPMWKQNLVGLLLQHIVPDMALNASEIFDNQKTELSSMRDLIAINQFALAVQTAELTEEKDVQASNGVLHIISKVLRPKFLDESFADLELQTELGPDDLGRTALTDVVDFVDGRNELKIIRQEGLTFVGCRIRAFNRLEEYLPQTVNEAPEGVILGEFLNASYTTETTRNLIQYSLIPKNYYREDMENGFAELTVPLPGCGHMWVTKMDDKLCFNNGCVVDEPEPREYLASNGYVSDTVAVVVELLKH